MLDSTTALPNTTAALAGVEVVYVAEEPQARRLLAEMVAVGRIAIDIETAMCPEAVERLAGMLRAKAEIAGALKALRKLKAPTSEIEALVAKRKQLTVEIKYSETAALDPRRSRIRLLQVFDGGDRVLVIDLDHVGPGILELLDGVRRRRPQRGL